MPNRILATVASFLLFFSQAQTVFGSSILWNGGSGNWSTAGNWTPAMVPNNGGGSFFDVMIGSGVVNSVILDITPRVDSLVLVPSASLSFNSGSSLILGDLTAGQVGVLTNAGTVNITNANSTLTFDLQAPASSFSSNTGTVNAGAGTIAINDAGTNSGSAKALVLAGAGSITLAGGSIQGVSGDEQLFTTNAIQGYGTIQNLQLNLESGGTITANRAGQTLTVAAPTGGAVFNDGVISSSPGATLVLDASANLSGFVNNSDGTIQTAGGSITLNGSAGTTSLFNNGTFTVGGGDTFTFVGNGSNTYTIQNNGAWNVGTAAAGGILSFNGAGSAFFIQAFNPGIGELSLSDNSGNLIQGVTGSETLVNDVGHTISGAGHITNLTFVNNGTIGTNGNNNLIIDNLQNYDPVAQTLNALFGGTYQTNGAGNLEIGNAGNGIVTNDAVLGYTGAGRITDGSGNDIVLPFLQTNNGSLMASNTSLTFSNAVTSFGSVQVTNSGTLTFPGFSNSGGSVLIDGTSQLNITGLGGWADEQGGVLTNGGTFFVAGTLRYAGNDINTIDLGTTLTLDGAGKLVNTAGVNPDAISNSLTTNNGLLTFQNGANYTLTQSLTNSGSLTVQTGATLLTNNGFTNTPFANITIGAGSTFDVSAGTFANESGGVLSNGNIFDSGTFRYNGNNITSFVSSVLTLDGAGQFLNANGGNHNALTTLTSVDANSALILSSGASLALTGALTTQGALVIGDGVSASALSAPGVTNNGGTVSIASLSTADFRGGPFGSLNAGTLAAGSYIVDGTLLYTGGQVAVNNASVTIGPGGVFRNNAGLDVFSGALTTNNGSIDVSNYTGGNNLITPGTFTQGANASLALRNGSLMQVNGGFTNGPSSSVFLFDSSTLTIAGALDNSASFAAINAEGGTLTANGFNNGTTGTLNVAAGSAVNVAGTGNNAPFASLTSAGTLTGGAYDIEGTFQFGSDASGVSNNAMVTTISSATNVTLGGAGSFLNGAGNNALSSLSVIDGIFTLDNGATLNLTSGSLTVSSGAELVLSDSPVGAPDFLSVNGPLSNLSFTEVLSGTLQVAGGFTNGTNANLILSSDFGNGSRSVAVGGALVNNGYIQVDDNGALTASGFTNNRSIIVDSTSSANFTGGAFTNLSSGNVLTGGTYSISGAFQYDGANTINELASGTSLTLNGPSFSVTNGNGNALANLQTVDSGALLQLENNATLSVSSGFTNQGTTNVSFSSLNVTGGSFNNQGSLTVTNGNIAETGQFVNSGTVGISVGLITSQGLSNSGALNMSNGSVINATGGTFTNLDNSGNLQGGSYSLSGGSLLIYSGGGINNILANTTVVLSDTSGILNNPGTGAVNALTNLASNAGNLTIQSGYNISTPGAFTNASTGVLTVGPGASTFSTVGQFSNAGTTYVSGGALMAASVNNSGALNLQSGTLTTGGSFTNTATGTVNLGTFASVVTATAASFDNAGPFNYTGSGSGSADTLTVTGAATNSGTLQETALNSSFSASTLTNSSGGVFTASGTGTTLTVIAALTNQGSMEIGSGAAVTAGSVSNSGSFKVDSGASVALNSGDFTQTAGSTQVDGTLTASNIMLMGGTFKGTGTITGALINSGLLAPGDSPGALALTGNYSESSGGDLLIQFAGSSDFSALNVSGSANIGPGSDVEFSFLAGVPDPGTYTFLTALGGASGTFDAIMIDDNLSNYTAVISYMPFDDTVTFESPGETPEPSTAGMAILGLIGGAIALRRRRRA